MELRPLSQSDDKLLSSLEQQDDVGQGLAKQACKLVMAWAFDTVKLERIIACIDDGNDGARSIASKLGMTELCAGPPGRTVYVKHRGERS